MQLVVEFADIGIPGSLEATEPDQDLRDFGQHVDPLGQDLIQAGHGWIHY